MLKLNSVVLIVQEKKITGSDPVLKTRLQIKLVIKPLGYQGLVKVIAVSY